LKLGIAEDLSRQQIKLLYCHRCRDIPERIAYGRAANDDGPDSSGVSSAILTDIFRVHYDSNQ